MASGWPHDMRWTHPEAIPTVGIPRPGFQMAVHSSGSVEMKINGNGDLFGSRTKWNSRNSRSTARSSPSLAATFWAERRLAGIEFFPAVNLIVDSVADAAVAGTRNEHETGILAGVALLFDGDGEEMPDQLEGTVRQVAARPRERHETAMRKAQAAVVVHRQAVRSVGVLRLGDGDRPVAGIGARRCGGG